MTAAILREQAENDLSGHISGEYEGAMSSKRGRNSCRYQQVRQDREEYHVPNEMTCQL